MVGLLNSLGGYGGLVTSLVQPVGGWMSDQTGHKKFVAWASVVAIAAMGFYFMAGQTRNWQLLIPAVILLGISALSRPARGALVAESSGAANRGTAYSLIFAASVIPGIFAPLLGGYISEEFGRPNVFFVGLLFEVISLAVLLRWLSESRVLSQTSVTARQIVGIFKRVVIPPPHLRAFYLCMAGDSFAWGAGFGVLFGALSLDYGYTDAQLGALNSIVSATMVLTQMPLGWLIDRYGAKPSMIASEVLGIPMMLIMLAHTEFEWLAAAYVVLGLVGATWGPAIMTYLTNQTPAGSRSEAIGQMSAFRGLLAFPAPALGGWLYEVGGFRAPIIFCLGGIIVLIVGLAFFVKEEMQPANA
jgi:MFS family permease